MSKKKLIILTHNFPIAQGEEFLKDEIAITSAYFDEIIIYPNSSTRESESIHKLPQNVRIVNILNFKSVVSNSELAFKLLPVLWKEFTRISSKKLFFSLLKFNLSLLKQSYNKALNVINLTSTGDDTVVYSYWCDDLATTGAYCKKLRPDIHFISRAHGFDVFEEQSDFNHIFFRQFQLASLDRLWPVSKAGATHLKAQNPSFSSKIEHQYLGIKSNGVICFEKTEVIRIVTCSHIRSIKRLDLLVKALKLSRDAKIEWHVIGAGEDLEHLRKASEELPPNCKTVFHGHQKVDKIHQLYSEIHFDFLVSLSSSEGLPVSMMEAISHGIPVLATDVGGCKEIVNQTTGVLISATFGDQELIRIILNCKDGDFNELKKRQDIVEFWKRYFNSELNYKKFAEEILTIA